MVANRFFKLLENIDVKPLRDYLELNPYLFEQIKARQEYEGTAHKDTECIFIRGPKEFTKSEYMGTTSAMNYWCPPDLGALVRDLINKIRKEILITRLGYILIVKLKAGGVIDKHIDQGIYAAYYKRMHLVISSKEGNSFYVEDEEKQFKEGELWGFNHRVEHYVVNNSDSDRIHLILDFI